MRANLTEEELRVITYLIKGEKKRLVSSISVLSKLSRNPIHNKIRDEKQVKLIELKLLEESLKNN
jgi:hypothetical protein